MVTPSAVARKGGAGARARSALGAEIVDVAPEAGDGRTEDHLERLEARVHLTSEVTAQALDRLGVGGHALGDRPDQGEQALGDDVEVAAGRLVTGAHLGTERLVAFAHLGAHVDAERLVAGADLGAKSFVAGTHLGAERRDLRPYGLEHLASLGVHRRTLVADVVPDKCHPRETGSRG